MFQKKQSQSQASYFTVPPSEVVEGRVVPPPGSIAMYNLRGYTADDLDAELRSIGIGLIQQHLNH